MNESGSPCNTENQSGNAQYATRLNSVSKPSRTVFGYAFPHRKTVDVLRVVRPEVCIAAPWQELNLPRQVVETMPHSTPPHPRDVCKELGVEYVEAPHSEAPGGDVAVIGGARILPEHVILRYGRIINIHPGLIPENRGLDNTLRCFLEDLPAGVTSHIISPRIDAGIILERRQIPVYPTDTIVTIGERIYQTGLKMLPRALQLTSGPLVGKGGYRPPLSEAEQLEAAAMFEEWKWSHGLPAPLGQLDRSSSPRQEASAPT